jgi:hypothetical protein
MDSQVVTEDRKIYIRGLKGKVRCLHAGEKSKERSER